MRRSTRPRSPDLGRGLLAKSRRGSFLACAAVLLSLAASAARAQEVNKPAEDIGRPGAELVKEGNKLLAEGKYEAALAVYDKAAAELPDSPVVAYNRGLALYRLGRFDKAERVMQDALKSGNPELEAKAKYNLGRCAHESAITRKDSLQEAVNEVSRAIRFYQDALQLAPDDPDAKTNLDLAERFRAFLEQRLEEQKQQPQCSQPSSQPSSQPDEPNQTSQPGSQPQDGEQDQQDQGDEQQQDKEQGDRRDEAREGETGEEGEQQGAQKQADEQKDESKKESDEMKAAEVEPMLQEARDAERQRREAKRQQAIRIRGKIKPDKDW